MTEQQHNNNTRHLRDLIELEVYYPTNVLAVLRTLPAADLATLEQIFGQMQDERLALKRRREEHGQ